MSDAREPDDSATEDRTVTRLPVSLPRTDPIEDKPAGSRVSIHDATTAPDDRAVTGVVERAMPDTPPGWGSVPSDSWRSQFRDGLATTDFASGERSAAVESPSLPGYRILGV